MSEDAVELLADHAGTYPYAVQLYGFYAWRASDGQSGIDVRAAERGAQDAKDDLYSGILATRWGDAGEAQREYLAAVAQLIADGVSAPKGGDVAKLLGVTTPQLSVTRDAVIERGLLAETDRTLSFAIPAMAQFVRERYARDLDVDIDGLREPLLAHIAERRAARAVRNSAG